MNFMEVLKSSLRSLRSNKIRSFLTMLGIIIGISSVIIISMVGRGSQRSITGELVELADKTIVIQVQSDNKILNKRDFIDAEDLKKIREISNVKGVSPSLRDRVRLTTIENIPNFSLCESTTTDFEVVSGVKILFGRTFREDEVNTAKKVVIIDDVYATRRFGRIDIAGEEIEIQLRHGTKLRFLVSGVFENPLKNFMSSFGSGRENYQIYVPYTTFQKYIEDNLISSINISVEDINKKDNTAAEIIKYLEESHKKEGIYQISARMSPVSSFNNILNTLALLLTSVGAISLLVGGIGIMNIMLVSVTERIREIGIRKALGAKKRDILFQFLVEAVILSLLGGAIGIILGITISEIAGIIIKIKPYMDYNILMLTVAVSSGIGIIFGTYPAKKASDLNPIEALRYE